MHKKLREIESRIAGELKYDEITRIIYSTDASVYKEKPIAVCWPKSEADIQEIVRFAGKHKIPLTPRTAGTSLAGQVVANGIILDVSKYMTNILELNTEEQWVLVQPGVVLEELNNYLADFGLFFGPETSTANRCMIGGMLGNNACGSHALIYGSTRDHTLEVRTVLSDGSIAEFKELQEGEFKQKEEIDNLEGKIYRDLKKMLSVEENQKSIRKNFPDPELKRRNTGYAIDLLLNSSEFTSGGEAFNMSKVLGGSEGTLAISTAIKLNLIPLPPSQKAVICAHFNSVNEALHANLIALEYQPGAVEIMDHVVLECTKSNINQQKNRFFLQGEPGAILIIEFARDEKKDIEKLCHDLIKHLKEKNYGYHYPVIWGEDINRVWDLRKAGLGLLGNLPGDEKSVTFIEDTAVHVNQLPEYIEEVQDMLKSFDLSCVYHAHVGTGELHMRPVLNLKTADGVEKFKKVALETAKLVKKYRGSLSGEHGDGRVRGSFIPLILGEKNYQLLKQFKASWDPDHILNPGKIIDVPPIDSKLRYNPSHKNKDIETIFDFSGSMGYIRAVEKCNGSGDCRKTENIGGTMCPSYMATRDEKNTTRARANVLRELITGSQKKNPFDHPEIYEIMDLCLSCKACKSECPSSVDMAKLKAEFLQHYYDAHHVPFRSWLVANITKINRIASVFTPLSNFFLSRKWFSKSFNALVGFSVKRSMPLYSSKTLNKWSRQNLLKIQAGKQTKKTRVLLFNDEFTNYNDAEIGIKALKLLTNFGYSVIIPKHFESGRTYLSKGLIRKAKSIANKNISHIAPLIDKDTVLIGIEPSAILAFRDEYPELCDKNLRDDSGKIASQTYLFDEFISKEIKAGNIPVDMFTKERKNILLHGHCQQKAIASTKTTIEMLSVPVNYAVEEIKSGCCGMAGSFGFEKEHYEVSMKVGELVLFPSIRKASKDTIISAPGTSCRQQIKDGTGRKAYHPIEILYDALNS